MSAKGVMLLSTLGNLCVLDLGGLPVTDQALSSLQVIQNSDSALCVDHLFMNFNLNADCIRAEAKI